ncbi:MAG: hypothetical protein HY855_17675 [Burkholderiales bacterium]|nr:hypothetical protein [Burkholderiales bacterium]
MKTLIALTILATSLAGCGTVDAYRRAGEDTRRGGNIDQGMAAEQKKQQEAAAQKQTLEDKKISAERDAKKMQQQVAAAQDQTKAMDGELARALSDRKLTQAKHDELKAQQASLKAELASLQLKNAADQRKPLDPKVEADKARHLAELEAKQKKLEAELAQALKTK